MPLLFGEIRPPEDVSSGGSVCYVALSSEEVAKNAIVCLYVQDELHEEASGQTVVSGREVP